MRRHLLPLAAALALTAASVVTALAHAGLEKSEAPAGSYKAVVSVPHGCDGQATHTVRIDLPEGFIGAKPMPKAGWQLAIEKGDYAKPYKLHGREISSGAKAITWSGGDLADDNYDEFVVSGTLAGEPGTALPFIVKQLCADGQVVWDQIAEAGQNPHSLERPAPVVTIGASTAGGHDGHGGHGDHAAAASEVTVGDLTVSGYWLKAMLPGQPAGGGYLTVTNKGGEADRLVAVSTAAAGKSEIHEMSMENDVMKMRQLPEGVEIPAGATVELKPGGYHLMFMQVTEPFKEGATVPVTLEFEKAGKVEVAMPVRSARGGDDHSGHGAHGQGG